MLRVTAHIGGLPFEETIAQLAPAGVALIVALRAACVRMLGSRAASRVQR